MTIAMSSAVVHDGHEHISVILSVHGREPPSDPEWDVYVNSIDATLQSHRADLTRVRGVSLSAGGGPTTLQRDRLNRLLADRSVRVAIVTHSALVRGVVTALNWFNPTIRTFAPAKFPDALRYLELPSHTQGLLRSELRGMSSGLPDAALMIETALG